MAHDPGQPPAPPGAAPQCAPSAERNAGAILEVLKSHLPETGRVLEVASGTGQHAAAFAQAFPGIVWQPSDPDEQARASIAAWIRQTGAGNILPPLDLDMTLAGWHDKAGGPFDAVLAINLVHISPWQAAEGLLAGAGALLGPQGLLYLYGAYRCGGEHTAESNVRFDEWLKAQDPDWGVRDMGEVEREAARHGLRLAEAVPMPANNFSLVFRKGL